MARGQRVQISGQNSDFRRVGSRLQSLVQRSQRLGSSNLSQHIQQTNPHRSITDPLARADRVQIDVLETLQIFANGGHGRVALFGKLFEGPF